MRTTFYCILFKNGTLSRRKYQYNDELFEKVAFYKITNNFDKLVKLEGTYIKS